MTDDSFRSAVGDVVLQRQPDEVITVGNRTYRRLHTAGDAQRQRLHGAANIRVTDEATGAATNVTGEEDTAFWEWAVVETLRHSGLRIEELLTRASG